MRLLDARTLELKDFVGQNIPKYAILSHTWREGEEISFQELQCLPSQSLRVMAKSGFAKIRQVCDMALTDGFDYAWVDTCCIDKTSSAELSEAINSMVTWYEQSEVCYAFLEDVPSGTDLSNTQSTFANARWFSRGWTLQELIAPTEVRFLASDWSLLATKRGLSGFLSEITGINLDVLLWNKPKPKPSDPRLTKSDLRFRLNSASIAQRMSWAANRLTTRVEDTAYCLLGIFGINMPLLYGEGSRAFFRLQEEILKHSDDQSILAWKFHDLPFDSHVIGRRLHRHLGWGEFENDEYLGTLAESPLGFRGCKNIIVCDVGRPTSPFAITNKGLQMELPLAPRGPARDFISWGIRGSFEYSYTVLQCQDKDAPGSLLALPLRSIGGQLYTRSRKLNPVLVDYQLWFQWRSSTVYLLTQPALLPQIAFETESAPGRDDTKAECCVILRNVPPDLFITDLNSLTDLPPQIPTETGPLVLLRGSHGPGNENGIVVTLKSKTGGDTVLSLFVYSRWGSDGFFAPYLIECCLGKGQHRYWGLYEPPFLRRSVFTDEYLYHCKATSANIFGNKQFYYVDIHSLPRHSGELGGLSRELLEVAKLPLGWSLRKCQSYQVALWIMSLAAQIAITSTRIAVKWSYRQWTTNRKIKVWKEWLLDPAQLASVMLTISIHYSDPAVRKPRMLTSRELKRIFDMVWTLHGKSLTLSMLVYSSCLILGSANVSNRLKEIVDKHILDPDMEEIFGKARRRRTFAVGAT